MNVDVDRGAYYSLNLRGNDPIGCWVVRLPRFYRTGMNIRPPAFHRYTCPVTTRKGACDCSWGNNAALQGIEEEDEEMEEDYEEDDEKENKKVIPERKKDDKQKDTKSGIREEKGHDDRDQRSLNQGARDFYKPLGYDRRLSLGRDGKAVASNRRSNVHFDDRSGSK